MTEHPIALLEWEKTTKPTSDETEEEHEKRRRRKETRERARGGAETSVQIN